MTGRQAAAGVSGALGRYGEETAARYLTDRGYTVLARNWQCRREGELDIVALAPDHRCIVAVEVKTRRTAAYGSPLEAVTWSKARRLRKLVLEWCREHHPHTAQLRVDVIGITVVEGRPPHLEHVVGVGS